MSGPWSGGEGLRKAAPESPAEAGGGWGLGKGMDAERPFGDLSFHHQVGG